MEPRTTLAQCQQCTLSAHAACYGVAPGADFEDWYCEFCQLEREQPKNAVLPTWPTFNMDPAKRLPKPIRPSNELDCALCPEIILPDVPKDKEALTALDILKPTDASE
jgi:hypothetical protein